MLLCSYTTTLNKHPCGIIVFTSNEVQLLHLDFTFTFMHLADSFIQSDTAGFTSWSMWFLWESVSWDVYHRKKKHGPENVQRYKNTLKGTEEPQGHYVYNGKGSLWCVVDVAYLWPDQENFKAVLDPTSTLKELREEKNNNFVSSVWEQSLALVKCLEVMSLRGPRSSQLF